MKLNFTKGFFVFCLLSLFSILFQNSLSAQTFGKPVRDIDLEGSGGSVGKYTSFAVINGKPAACYYDEQHEQLMYCRAEDSAGTKWGKKIIVDDVGSLPTIFLSNFNLLEVEGKPVIVYYNSTTSTINYNRSLDSSGIKWSQPTILFSSVFLFGNGFTSVQIINDKPAVVYCNPLTYRLNYIRSIDNIGKQWLAPVEINISFQDNKFFSLKEVLGKPALAYECNNQLQFMRALDSLGENWDAPVKLDSSQYLINYSSLEIINGIPAIAYQKGNSNMKLNYIRALDAEGKTWSSPVIANSHINFGAFASLQEVNGKPAISFTNFDKIAYSRALDVNGSAWNPEVIIDSGSVGNYSSLKIVNGYPASIYYDTNNKRLKYAKAVDSVGTAWSIQSTISGSGDLGISNYLQSVSGRPAICYNSSTKNLLKYVRASDSFGIKWQDPIVIDSLNYPINDVSFKIINSRPAVSYLGRNYKPMYMYAKDSVGNLWNSPVIADTSNVSPTVYPYIVMNEIKGIPNLLYLNGDLNHLIRYCHALDSTGTNWAASVKLPTLSINVPTNYFFRILNGKPLYYYFSNKMLKCIRALDSLGDKWDSTINLAYLGSVNDISMQVIKGKLGLVYREGKKLKFVRTNDSLGLSLGSALIIDTLYNEYIASLSLVIIDNKLAISYRTENLNYTEAIDDSGSTWRNVVQVINKPNYNSIFSCSLSDINHKPAFSLCIAANSAGRVSYIGTCNPPGQPIITKSGAILSSTPAQYYQWYRNDSTIIGANSQTYQVAVAGAYKVSVSDDDNCYIESDTLQVKGIVLNVSEINANKLKIYPNPTNNQFTIDGLSGNGSIKIYDLYGRFVVEKVYSNGGHVTIDISDLNAGMYLISTSGNNAKPLISKVVKIE